MEKLTQEKNNFTGIVSLSVKAEQCGRVASAKQWLKYLTGCGGLEESSSTGFRFSHKVAGRRCRSKLIQTVRELLKSWRVLESVCSCCVGRNLCFLLLFSQIEAPTLLCCSRQPFLVPQLKIAVYMKTFFLSRVMLPPMCECFSEEEKVSWLFLMYESATRSQFWAVCCFFQMIP